MLKKILIFIGILAFGFFGIRSYQGTQRKHQNFLLQQSLITDLRSELQKSGSQLMPLNVILHDRSFEVVLSKPQNEQDLEIERRKVFELINTWKSQSPKFKSFEHAVVFANEIKAP